MRDDEYEGAKPEILAMLGEARDWLKSDDAIPFNNTGKDSGFPVDVLSLAAKFAELRTLRSVEPAPMVELEGETPFLQRALGVINTLSSEADDEEIAVKFTAAFTSIRAEAIEECAKVAVEKADAIMADAEHSHDDGEYEAYEAMEGAACVASEIATALRSLSTKGAGK